MTRALVALGLALALLGVGLWAWDEYVRDPYVAQGDAQATARLGDELEQALGAGIRTPAAAAAILKRQAAAVDDLKRASAERLARAEAAREAAAAGIATLAARVQSLLAAQPAFPDDPCASACRLLAQPL
jgi:hypothetical protein